MKTETENIYCEGGPLNGQVYAVEKGAKFFNIRMGPFDFGNGPQDIMSHYERTDRKREEHTVFYSDPDWDR